MTLRLPIRVAAAGLLIPGTVAVQTCFDFLAASVNPPMLESNLVVGFSSLMRRQSDGRLFSITLDFTSSEPLNTQGFVCCHSGLSPELSPGGDGAGGPFAATYVVTVSCTGPYYGTGLSATATIIDPATVIEARNFRAGAVPARVGPLMCGSRNSYRCKVKFSKARKYGDTLGVCSKCALDDGPRPLSSRCQLCCQKCDELSCFNLPGGEVPAPTTPDGLPLSGPVFQADVSMPVTLFSVVTVEPDGAAVLFTPTEGPSSVVSCCFQNFVPSLGPPGLPGSGSFNVSESFTASFKVSRSGCSSSPVLFADPFVFEQALAANFTRS